ncbi:MULTISPECIES: CDP-diacylglycerol--glycerol-3-phosphate 3-phosphatidyltransferase [Sinobaca]|uniref:CDP-diacylglycerol--glycerol-3-phosphate 3-phosphatidyltransferase n=1 Tax=Sinobaca qinghaiensis TaxID=342944 RepID=A0A419V5U7_9BACL|nr:MULTISPECIES: CDP-diacylglycerol--glycerol-3-phosphate 3-phosphatidyltransferase [Sinobaca]RKD75318.1 CDP-diacylglycerol--glycerol-3-phosphate 3-phosphatidyltransferase [Sinobaca qinghaiensis]
MNLPNKITLARIALIPLFVFFMLIPPWFGMIGSGTSSIPVSHVIGGVIFIVAAATDWLDGYIARKHQLITSFGKFLDPLADKLLVTAALLALIDLQLLPSWMAIVILSREFAVTGIRLVAAAEGDVIAASGLGKWKTVFQMAAITVLLFHNLPFSLIGLPLGMGLMWIAVILTIVSGVDYFMKNRHVMLKST